MTGSEIEDAVDILLAPLDIAGASDAEDEVKDEEEDR